MHLINWLDSNFYILLFCNDILTSLYFYYYLLVYFKFLNDKIYKYHI